MRSLLPLLGLLLMSVPVAAAERPNIVLIMTDDQGYGDLGITGNPVIRTPNIDAMAEASAALSNFYVSPVCSPTRACLMTGRYNHRTRVIDTFKGRSMMEPEETTVAELLQDAGYATGIFGKWHLGDNYPLRPNDQGFEDSLVHRGGGLAQPSEPLENDRRYTDPILFRNGEKVQTEGYCTDVYFDAAMEFIERSHSAGRPFFVYLATNAPHSPYHDVPQELYDHYRSIDLSPVLEGNNKDADVVARVFAMIENVDQNVGRLRRQLQAQGIEANTLVIFMVDNGPNTRRFVGPFRGKKSEVHEGGIRSPFFAHWPARLQGAMASDQIAAHIDVMPTLLDAAGVPVPESVALDGRSVLPLLEGRAGAWPDRHLVLQAHRGDRPVPFHNFAIRNQNWKLLHPTGFQREQMPEAVPFELYDMTTDPGETVNLVDSHPEVIERMKRKYRAWLRDVSSTRPGNYAPPRIVIGADAEPHSVLTPQDWRTGGSGGWGTRGRWLVDVANAGDYDVEVIWKQPVGPAVVSLQIGDAEHALTLEEPRSTVQFEALQIPAGNAAIGVVAIEDDQRRDPYHVHIRRK